MSLRDAVVGAVREAADEVQGKHQDILGLRDEIIRVTLSKLAIVYVMGQVDAMLDATRAEQARGSESPAVTGGAG